jgi:hypothetical protein
MYFQVGEAKGYKISWVVVTRRTMPEIDGVSSKYD